MASYEWRRSGTSLPAQRAAAIAFAAAVRPRPEVVRFPGGAVPRGCRVVFWADYLTDAGLVADQVRRCETLPMLPH